MYTRVIELNYWSSTECKSAQYNEKKKEWKVVLERNGQTIVVRPKQLAVATGISGLPSIPDFPGQGSYTDT